jgi:hypothetical protein
VPPELAGIGSTLPPQPLKAAAMSDKIKNLGGISEPRPNDNSHVAFVLDDPL